MRQSIAGTSTAARASTGLRAAVDLVSHVFSWLSGAFTLLLLVMLVAEVVVREVVGRSLLGTIELSEVLLVLIVALGVSYAQKTGSHVSTDLVTSRFAPTTAAVIRVVGMVVAAGFLLWTAWASAERGWESFESGESRFGITSVPVWPARLVLPVGLALLGVQCLFTAWDAWSRRNATTDDAPTASPGTAPASGREPADVS